MKKDLISNAIEIIRENIKLANQYTLEKDFEMYEYMLKEINVRIDFLFELDLINYDKYRLLSNVVNNMI